MGLFDPNLVYPCDREGGRHVDLEGVITKVGDIDIGGEQLREVSVTVQTKHGPYTGFVRYPRTSAFCPEPGHHATIRVYDCGGGWYPDNRIISWGNIP